MMFGDDDEYWRKLSEELLEVFSFNEILEMNDLDEILVIGKLIQLGLISTLDDYS